VGAQPGVAPDRRVTWLGHATTLIEVGGVRLLTDPILRRRIAHLSRSAALPGQPEAVDAVLISHLHHDHLDLPSLRRVPSGTPVLGPAGTRALVRDRTVQEVATGDTVEIGGAEIRVVHAEHAVRRYPWGESSPAVGFVVAGIYFAGDTDIYDAMASIGPLDVALLPVWGWGPTLGPGHLDPAHAARALTLLRPRIAVPIHWGTYLPLAMHRRYARLLSDPGPEFAARARETAPNVRVEILAVGETLEV
jgi:L-ascorbate metabolism protein UlaG (beta-lactamase superfamily)